MSSASRTLDAPVDSAPRQTYTDRETSRAWWFLGTLAVLRNPVGAPRLPAVIDLTVPPGGSPPRHIHDELEDSFLVLEGEVVVRCGQQTIVGKPGTYVVVPLGTEHTFRVTSPGPARLLLIHADDSFLQLIEAAGTPAGELRLPPSGEFDLDIETLVRLNEEHDSRIVGPSLEEDDARAVLGDDRAAGAAEVTLGPVNHLSLRVTDVGHSAEWYADAFSLMRLAGRSRTGSGRTHTVQANQDSTPPSAPS
jgi:quercetin dioxygenase-like cupin family protein